jgi:hypothetical protein
MSTEKKEETRAERKLREEGPKNHTVTRKSHEAGLGAILYKQLLHKQLNTIRGEIIKSNEEITITFIHPKTITHSPTIANQILIKYKDGSYELLRRGISGDAIKHYLGLSFANIESYAFLPTQKICGDKWPTVSVESALPTLVASQLGCCTTGLIKDQLEGRGLNEYQP